MAEGQILVRAPWTNPPNTNIRLNRGHWLARGLSYWYPSPESATVWRDHSAFNRGLINLDSGTSVRIATQHGNHAMDFTAGDSEFTTSDVDSLPGTAVITVGFWAKGSAYVGSAAAVAFYDLTGGGGEETSIYPFDNRDGDGFRIFHTGTQLINQNSGAAPVNEWHHYVFTSRDATDHELYVDSISVGSSSTSKTINTAVDRWAIGHKNGTQNATFELKDITVHLRGMTSAEVSAWFDVGNRWGLYEPLNKYIPVGLAAVGGATPKYPLGLPLYGPLRGPLG